MDSADHQNGREKARRRVQHIFFGGVVRGGKQALAREGGQPHPSNSWSYQIPIGLSQFKSPSPHNKATLSPSPGLSLYRYLLTPFSRAAALVPLSSKCSLRPSLRR